MLGIGKDYLSERNLLLSTPEEGLFVFVIALYRFNIAIIPTDRPCTTLTLFT